MDGSNRATRFQSFHFDLDLPAPGVTCAEPDVPSPESSRRPAVLTPDQRQLITKHIALARSVVARIRRKNARLAHVHDELLSLGQDALVTAARAYDPGSDGDFRSFARRRVRNRVLRVLRKRAIAATDVAFEPFDDSAADVEAMRALGTSEATVRASSDPENEIAEHLDTHHALAALPKARATLDPRSQDVIRLRIEEGLNWSQVAAHLDVDPSTARRVFHAALTRLERLLRTSA
jgi:RNA polymerase sigma factor (sigma-70 family)